MSSKTARYALKIIMWARKGPQVRRQLYQQLGIPTKDRRRVSEIIDVLKVAGRIEVADGMLQLVEWPQKQAADAVQMVHDASESKCQT